MNRLGIVFLLLLQAPSTSGAFTGVIRGADGAPRAGIRVVAMEAAPDPDASAGAILLASVAATDAAGRFRLEGLAPGRYYIAAGPFEFLTYYPGGNVLSKATVVSVARGAVVTDMDFPVVRQGWTIQGRLLASVSGQALPANVVLTDTSSTSATRRLPLQTTVAPEGWFEFRDVLPGRYSIAASPTGLQPSGSNPSQNLSTAAPVVIVVDRGDITGIAMLLPPPTVTVTVRVAVDGGGPPGGPELGAELGLIGGPSGNTVTVAIRGPGTFTLEMPPGVYSVFLSGALTGYALSSMSNGGTDLRAELLKVVAGSSPEIVVRFTKKPEIEGR